jgi:hypothetical protein
MDKAEKVLRSYFDIGDDLNAEHVQAFALTLHDMLLEFGKECFNAALENKKFYNPEKDGSLTMITIIQKYKTFENYLNSLE